MNDKFILPKPPNIKLKESGEDKRMFAVMPIRAIKDKRLTRGDYVNLMLLCSYCNSGGYSLVALTTMANYKGVSKQAMSQGIKKLIKLGYVEQLRGGYTGLRGALRRVIYDSNLKLRDVAAISNTPIKEEIMRHNKNNQLAPKVKKATIDNSRLTFDEAILVVGEALKTEADLSLLTNLVSRGISRTELLEAFAKGV